ncbi:hypothetical protein ACFW6Q_26825 [Streptomyces sp. NPDC058737]
MESRGGAAPHLRRSVTEQQTQEEISRARAVHLAARALPDLFPPRDPPPGWTRPRPRPDITASAVTDPADRYVRGLFQNVGHSLSNDSRPLHQLATDHETPKGNNERIHTTWFDPANAAALKEALDGLLSDLK